MALMLHLLHVWRVPMPLILLTLLIIFGKNVLAEVGKHGISSNQSQMIDRRALYEGIYERFSLLMMDSLKIYISNYKSRHGTDIDNETWGYLKYILETSKKYNREMNVKLNFSNDVDSFRLAKGQPPRIFKFGAINGQPPNWGDPISVNLKAINDPGLIMSISEIFQLLVHEFAHFIPNKNQAKVNSIASELASYAKILDLETVTQDGTKLQLHNASEIINLIRSEVKYSMNYIDYLDINPFFFFAEIDGRIHDLSEELISLLEARSRVTLTEQGDGYFRNFFWNFEKIEPVNENDQRRSWFKIRTVQIDFVSEISKGEIDQTFFHNHLEAPEKVFELNEFVIGINRNNGKIDKIYDVERYSKTEEVISGDLKIISEENRKITIQIQIDESKNNLSRDSKLILLLTGDNKTIHHPIRRVSANTFEAIIDRPTSNIDLEISSVLVTGARQLFFREGLQILSNQTEFDLNNIKNQNIKSNILIEKIGINIGDKFYPLKKMLTIPRGEGYFEFLVRSEVPIEELRIVESRTYGILNSEANKHFITLPLEEEKFKHPAKRTNFQIYVFNKDKFVQQEIRKGVFKIKIPMEFTLSPLSNSGEMERRIQERIRQNPFELLMGMGDLINEFLEKSIQGNDLGLRVIHQVQITNRNFQKLQILPPQPFTINLMNSLPEVPTMSQQCKNLFNK